MRKIKFRAWEDGKMRRVDSFTWEEDWNYDVDLAKAAEPYAILMQFTGLTDKNGKEIYEGDVLGADHTPNTYTVQWDDAKSGWSVDGCTGYLRAWLNSWTLPLEVIGNIYENKELLK